MRDVGNLSLELQRSTQGQDLEDLLSLMEMSLQRTQTAGGIDKQDRTWKKSNNIKTVQ